VGRRFDLPFSLPVPPFAVLLADAARRRNGKKKRRREEGDLGGYVCKSDGIVTGFDG
jgi:hypothetical protein